MPLLAQAAEIDELGIVCGLQDRVVQTFGGTLSMSFPSPFDYTYFSVTPTQPFELFVLWDTSSAEPSQIVHGDLRSRFDNEDPMVRASMARLADFANEAAKAFADGDHDGLGAAMTASFDRRAMMCDLSPSHVRLVEMCRDVGCAANFTGSGGAVVGVFAADPEQALAQQARLRAAADAQRLGLSFWTP